MLLALNYRVMEHLGSLESTQEARVALGQLLRFFRALQTSRINSITSLRCRLVMKLMKFKNCVIYSCFCLKWTGVMKT